MRNLLGVILSIFITQQFVQAQPLFNEYNTKILSIDGRNAIIKDSSDIVLGSSGIVIHTFQEGLSSIVARADVIKKDGNTATIRFEIFKMVTQVAFPNPGILPSIGDNIKLNYLYNRALIVAPNYNIYNEVTKHFSNIQWIHPDIIGAYLAKQYKPNPDKQTFQKMCSINSASLIFFALNDNGVFVDCNNFKIIKTVKSGRIKKVQVPFYTRVTGIDTSWFKWGGSQISDYDSYYKNLLR